MTDDVSTMPSPSGAGVQSQPLPLSVGSLLDGRFVIERMLGAGGMGYVVLARHVDLEERVAIKLLLPGRADEDGRHRLVREARAAVKIKSDHVVRILDVVSTGPNAPYIVMEYLEGEDLAGRIDRGGPIGVSEAAEIVIQACEVVGEAHHRGLAHRDLKPSNIFLASKPGQKNFVKVLDFGISKVLDGAATERLTASNSLLGSPAYAAPEQLRDARSVDRRCDVWALGVVLYECVTGNIPFSGATIAEVCTRILESPPEPPPPERALPERFLAILDRCLQKDPRERYDNLGELASALREFAPAGAEQSLGYLAALAPGLPALPKESSVPSGGSRLAGAMAKTEAANTAQGQTYDTRSDVTRRRPVALAIVAFAAAAGLATFYSAKAVLPVASEPTTRASPAPAVPNPPETPAIVLSSAPTAEPSVEPSVDPFPVASATPSVSATPSTRPALQRPRPRPSKQTGKSTTPGAAWVDSR